MLALRNSGWLLLVLCWGVSAGCNREPTDPLARAEFFVNQGQWSDAVVVCNEILRQDPDQTAALLARGNAQVGLGEYAAAVQDYDRCIELLPDDAEAYYRRAIAHERLGNDELATQDKLQARSLDTLHKMAYTNELPPIDLRPQRTAREMAAADGGPPTDEDSKVLEDADRETQDNSAALEDMATQLRNQMEDMDQFDAELENAAQGTESSVVADMINRRRQKASIEAQVGSEVPERINDDDMVLQERQRIAERRGRVPGVTDVDDGQDVPQSPLNPRPIISTALPGVPAFDPSGISQPGASPYGIGRRPNIPTTGLTSSFSTRDQAPGFATGAAQGSALPGMALFPGSAAGAIVPGQYHANPVYVPGAAPLGPSTTSPLQGPHPAGTALPARPGLSTALPVDQLQRRSNRPITTGIQSGTSQ